jgi:hypothetical protein
MEAEPTRVTLIICQSMVNMQHCSGVSNEGLTQTATALATRGAHKILLRKSVEENPLFELYTDGIILKWILNNMCVYVCVCEGMAYIQLSEERSSGGLL